MECHGSIHWLQHLDSPGGIWSATELQIDVNEKDLRIVSSLPTKKGRVIRPNILMFGDWNWDSSRTERQGDALLSWLQKLNLRELVVIEIGAGTAVPTVRHQSERLQRAGAKLVRINPRESHGPSGTIPIPLGALEALSRIDSIMG